MVRFSFFLNMSSAFQRSSRSDDVIAAIIVEVRIGISFLFKCKLILILLENGMQNEETHKEEELECLSSAPKPRWYVADINIAEVYIVKSVKEFNNLKYGMSLH